MRKTLGAALASASLILVSQSTSAQVPYITNAVISAMANTMMGGKGGFCLPADKKVGDVITLPNGNTQTVLSTSGTSSLCEDPNRPVLGEVEFKYGFTPPVSIDLPASFKAIELTPLQRSSGAVMNARDSARNIAIYVDVVPRTLDSDGHAIANAMAKRISGFYNEGTVSDVEEVTIGGLHAYRYRVTGRTKTLISFGYTRVATLLEGSNEYVGINVGCRTDDFPAYRAEMESMAARVKWSASEKPQVVDPEQSAEP
ncbi:MULTISPECIES: hypothetical protein [Ralstonia solanacearum species complex]|uniref:hypothetical protein n=1 Tax=Ralstonia solanacearum species complex TaxID=3116862 RepID=UPI0020058EDA|nr:hypothetical protein [Ralstonia pseudosolanacearum]MCK4125577.1 hypothetical protein [Ralstonia pseudosolanacearum]